MLAAYDFSQFRTIVDIGGGNGAFLAALLRQQLKATGILGELPHVVSLAPGVLQQAVLRTAANWSAATSLKRCLPGENAYILKQIIHNWDDQRARAVLRNCHRSMVASARLLIIDPILPQQPIPEGAIEYLMDMTMLAVTRAGVNEHRMSFKNCLNPLGSSSYASYERVGLLTSSRRGDAEGCI